MNNYSIPTMEEVSDIAHDAHQQKLDEEQIRDEKILKLLSIYINEVTISFKKANVELLPHLSVIMRHVAGCAVKEDKFKSINLQ